MLAEVAKRPSAKVLILMNLLPLFGVVFLGWSIFNIVLLYWVENLVLGLINILKMITCRPKVEAMTDGFAKQLAAGAVAGSEEAKEAKINAEKAGRTAEKMVSVGHTLLKLFMIPFFTVHYFGFCAGHGMLVFAFFGGKSFGGGIDGWADHLPEVLTLSFVLSVIALFASHLFSFFANYIGRGEYRKTVVPVLMFQPYGRIVLLHVAVLFGGFAVMALGSPMVLLLILVVGKIVLDLAMHLREHRKAEAKT